MEYFLTTGPYNKRINSFPFTSCLKKDKFNLDDIIGFLEKENILNIYNIDSFKYYNNEKNIFQDINKDIIKPGKKIICEFHFDKTKDPLITNFKWTENYINREIMNIKNYMNKYSENIKKYDLIYLYASPILSASKGDNIEELNYMEEIRIIIDNMKKKGKQFNCMFECIGYDVLSDIIAKKKTKILHISSHGYLNKDEIYSLCLEDLNSCGQTKAIDISKLDTFLKINESKIKEIDLVIVSTCYSEDLGKLFLKYGAKNVIYICRKTPIYDDTSIKFTKHFYQNLIDEKSIEESFNEAKESLKTNGIHTPCCCLHWHTKSCPLKKFLTDKLNMRHHKAFDIFKRGCNCPYTEFNIHKSNCELYQQFFEILNPKFKEYMNEKLDKSHNLLSGAILRSSNIEYTEFNKKYNNSELTLNIKEEKANNNKKVIRICCCDEKNEVIHNEIEKIIYKSNESINNRNICPFKLNGKGKVFINSNISFHFDAKKRFAIKKRKNKMSDIFKNIKLNENGLNYSIFYGNKGSLKQDFSEVLCVYLKERDIIETYKIFRVNSEFDFIYMQNKILENTKLNSQNKNIKIINLDYINIEENLQCLEKIINLICLNSNYNKYNLYFLFILNPGDIIFDENEGTYYTKIKQLLTGKKIKIDYTKDNKNIFYLDNKIIEKEIESDKIKEDETFTLYHILSNMPSGLPDCFLKLIFEDYIYIKDQKKLIAKYPDNNWNYIKKDKRFDENIKEKRNMNYTYNCLFEILKIYISLLEYFISTKMEKIKYLGGNIHYICNAYNNRGIWKFQYSKNNIEQKLGKKILTKDFNIERHSLNILNLISLIVNNINIFKEIKSISYELDINLEKILILFPSYYFLKRDCLNVLKSCIHFCEKLLSNSYNKKDEHRIKRQNFLKQKLLLFLYSINETEDEIKKIKNEPEIEMEIKILMTIKSKRNIRKELEILLKDEKLKSDKIPFIYYEIAKTFFEENNYTQCSETFETILNLNNIDYLFKQRVIIDSCRILKSQFIKESLKENHEEKNEIIINEGPNMDSEIKKYELIMKHAHRLDQILKKTIMKELYYESYFLKKQIYDLINPDIVMLNTNPIENNFHDINLYFNNQYYILNQLKDGINAFIKIKSYILNKQNLNSALKTKGEILIIQSDDFTENADIVCESAYGESEIISLDKYFKYHNIKNIKYKVIILCFPKSSKFIELYDKEIDYKYLITFEQFDSSNINNNIMKNYNNSCIEFIINFINLSVKNKDDIVENIFNTAKGTFIKSIKDYINLRNYIILSTKEKDNLKIEYSKEIKEKEIFLYNPLIKFEEYCDFNKNYDNIKMINCLIKHLNQTSHQIFYTKKSNKDKYTQLCLEVMKYFYRHETFSELYYIDIKKNDKELLRSIVKRLNKMWDDENDEEFDENGVKEIGEEKREKKMCFVLINNCKWTDLLDIDIYSLLNCNSSFIIIYEDMDDSKKRLINLASKESTNENEESSIDALMKSLGEKKTFIIQYYDSKLLCIDDYSIYSLMMYKYKDKITESNLNSDLLNYKLDINKNGNLYDYINYGGPFIEEEAKVIFYKVLKCVEKLHINKYSHMDLELGNIMLDANYNPVLINFCTAREIKENKLTDYDGIINEYTPPELEGKNYNYDGSKVDIFQLGIILFKLVTGKNPFDNPDDNLPLSDEFFNLFNGMISHNPDNRFSFKDIYESDWLKKTNDMFTTNEKRLQDLEEKIKEVLENKKETINGNRLNINENINLHAENVNNFMNVNTIEEIPESEINDYNIIKIPLQVNHIELINLLAEKIKNDNDHYDKLICNPTKYIASFEVKKEINDAENKRKRIKLEIELIKISGINEYCFRICNKGKENYINSDEFYFNISKIKLLIDNIIENAMEKERAQ